MASGRTMAGFVIRASKASPSQVATTVSPNLGAKLVRSKPGPNAPGERRASYGTAGLELWSAGPDLRSRPARNYGGPYSSVTRLTLATDRST
jgi:hypothetical protein